MVKRLLHSLVVGVWLVACCGQAELARFEIAPSSDFENYGTVITKPGYYMLTDDLLCTGETYGIFVQANNVTIDLNGFTIEGTSAGDAAVGQWSILHNLTIRNGRVTGWQQPGTYAIHAPGMGTCVEDVTVAACAGGINLRDPATRGALVRNCRILNNDSSSSSVGISVPAGSIVEGCQLLNNLGAAGYTAITGGAACVVSGCTIISNRTSALAGLFEGICVGEGSIIADCTVRDCGSVDGYPVAILADSGSVVSDVLVAGNDAAGAVQAMDVEQGCVVNRVVVRENDYYTFGLFLGHGSLLASSLFYNTYIGAIAEGQCLVRDVQAYGVRQEGISIRGDGNRVEHCAAFQCGNGFIAWGSDNFFGHNLASGCGTNFSLKAGTTNHYGRIRTLTGNFSDWNWWANHEY